MAAESPGKSYLNTSAVNNLSFSIDSLQLGDSTRSLLSPLYDDDHVSLEEQSFHSNNDELSEGEVVGKSTRSKSSSEEDLSGKVTVKGAKGNGSKWSTSSSYTISNSTSFSTSSACQGLKVRDEICETELSPWEKWLLSKVIKDHERAKSVTKRKKIDKEKGEKEIAERMEKERKAELNRQEWLQLKDKEERISNELKRTEENGKAEKEQEERERIQGKSEESYKNWSKIKENERKERIQSKRKEECAKKETENYRKEQSQEEYQRWLEKAKKHPKSMNNHFGYLSGRVTGYYDWTCYPMPSYNNPKPWISPKVKKRYLGKIELQNPSPPLLFKEIEQRERNIKQKKTKAKE